MKIKCPVEGCEYMIVNVHLSKPDIELMRKEFESHFRTKHTVQQLMNTLVDFFVQSIEIPELVKSILTPKMVRILKALEQEERPMTSREISIKTDIYENILHGYLLKAYRAKLVLREKNLNRTKIDRSKLIYKINPEIHEGVKYLILS